MAEISEDNRFTLEEFVIKKLNYFSGKDKSLSQILHAIGLASKIISNKIRTVESPNILVKESRKNIHGESLKKMDLIAHEIFISVLNRSDIACIISEESQEVVWLNADCGEYIVCVDPIDGSSNIDVNVSTGSIFSVYKKGKNHTVRGEYEILQKGRKQVAAGYTLYGPNTILVFTTGQGVNMFTLDQNVGEFIYSYRDIKIPNIGTYYSVNDGNFNSWGKAIKKYIKHCQDDDPTTGRPYTSRYTGSMVSDIHRTMLYGGIFIYPNCKKYPHGKLRLMYECNPFSFIIEQAGGIAIDGKLNILDINPEYIHQRTPLFIGSRQNVEMLNQFINESP